jgi:hypothetical protein
LFVPNPGSGFIPIPDPGFNNNNNEGGKKKFLSYLLESIGKKFFAP